MYINMMVVMWLQYRKFYRMEELRQDGDYVIATRDARRDFETFRDLPFHSNCPIIATPLLLRFMKCKRIPIRTVTEFDNVYVTSMPMDSCDFDELVEWARKEINGGSLSEGKHSTCMYLPTVYSCFRHLSAGLMAIGY